ncbi:LolA family protein [Cognatishimia activa]|uniref:Lipoprotein chaperone n=1 Tax=Cognatishimia activa TaxID=1715691 RepID=A0A0P1ILH1_9RHOB|nr:outer membrane lipoprotein carrier protein LolA [Cognatishimia activa]CUI56263.1 lipoprotein chaperone [Cognatishimia activa]CUK24388.1 lipoprotein chaperone [Cognatishimia activa]
MKHLRFLIAPSLALAMAAPAVAEKLSLDQISAYLNGIGSAQTSFTQINDDNSISTGKLMIKRPGRARFEYDPPEAALVMAGGGQLAIFDLKSNEPPENYPLRRTPLWVILERNVNLKERDTIVGHSYDGTATTITAQDPKHPDRGTIQLHFTDNPVQLRQWVIQDQSGSETTVVLGEFKRDVQLANKLFNIQRLTNIVAPERDDD